MLSRFFEACFPHGTLRFLRAVNLAFVLNDDRNLGIRVIQFQRGGSRRLKSRVVELIRVAK